jgi:ribonuclease E
MARMMLIDALDPEETRVVITENGEIDHFDFVTKSKKQIKGNIYLGKVTRIEPSLQAAFVEYGGDKQGFLPFSEIHPDYYQIPVEDRKRLLEEAEAAAIQRERDADRADEEMENEGSSVDAADEEPARRPRGGVKRRGRRNLKRDSVAESADTADRVIASEAVEDSEAPEAGQPVAENSESWDHPDETTDADRQSDDEAQNISVTAEDTGDTESENGSVPESRDDDSDYQRSPRQSMARRYKIQEVMRPGQLVLVQVIKEERGNKGVSISTYISLAGRYCVLMPNSPRAGGISRKIASGEDRKRLREISDELKDIRGMNAIIRTAGIDRTRAEIKRDYEYLIKLWNQVREDALGSIAPATVYEENDIIKRSIRDYYNGELENIYVEGEASYRQAKDFMKMLTPSHAPRVKQYKEAQPIFTAYNIEPQLSELYHNAAPLRSGGYIVINPTEALISIDVNSGKSTTERNVEETAYKTNLEACDEIARQLRLRNLGGLVVIDFIDMGYHKNRRNIERAMKDALKADRARIQVGHISAFGLMELSRQRMGSSLEETTTQSCVSCKGTGRTMLPEAMVMQMLRNLQSFLADNPDAGSVTLCVSRAVMMALFNHYRSAIQALEAALNITLTVELHPDDHDTVYVFKTRTGARYDSLEGTVRKSTGGRSKKGRNQNNRRARNGLDNATPGGETEPGTDKSQRERKEVREPHQGKRPVHQEERPDTHEHAAQSGGQGESGNSETVEGENGAPVREGRKNNRNQRRRRARGGQRSEQNGQEQESSASETMISQDEPPTIATVPEPSRKATPVPKETRQIEASPPAVNTDIVKVVKIMHQDRRPASEPMAPPPEDTPTPGNKRRGWWQRVIEGQ